MPLRDEFRRFSERGARPFAVRHRERKHRQRGCKLAGKFRCKLVLCKGAALETLTHREGCKVAAVTDRSLARAILEHLDEQFTEYQAGEAVTNG